MQICLAKQISSKVTFMVIIMVGQSSQHVPADLAQIYRPGVDSLK